MTKVPYESNEFCLSISCTAAYCDHCAAKAFHKYLDAEGYRIEKTDNTRLKIYISGPLAGIPEFHKAEAELKAEGHIVLNPANNPDGLSYREYMILALAMVQCADAVYLLKGWSKSKGAKTEIAFAESLGLRILF